MNQKKILKQILSDEGRILEKYYWLHRLCRVSKIHKFANLRYKDIEDISYLARGSTVEELGKIIIGLMDIKHRFDTGVSECIEEFKELYERRRKHADS